MVNESKTYPITPFRTENREQLLELQKHHLSEDVLLSDAYLEWKYDQNPYLEHNHLYVAHDDDQLIGAVGAYGTLWSLGDSEESFVLPCLSDLVIHPNWRDRGLFPQLMDYALNDLSKAEFQYALDMSAMSNIAASQMIHGWRSPGFLQMAQWRLPRRSRPSRLKQLIKRIPLTTSVYQQLRNHRPVIGNTVKSQQKNAFDGIDLTVNSNTDVKNKPRISVSQQPRSKELAALIRRIGTSDYLHHIRDEQFFGWRFANPLSNYRFLYHETIQSGAEKQTSEQGSTWELDGYLVLQMSRWSGGSTNIVDWASTDCQVFKELLQYTINLGKMKGLNIWSSTVRDDFRDVLIELGFTFVNSTGRVSQDLERPTMLIKALDSSLLPSLWSIADKHLLDLANWDLYMIDSDNY